VALLYPLENPIRTYAWGSHTVLAELLGRDVPSKEPEAELWIGAHPTAPSMIRGTQESLLQLIEADPAGTLGPYGERLPFLLKVLAVDAPLSLQVHPDAEQAAAGFAREEAQRPRVRSYHDDQPKPELLCALTPFLALYGFREPAESCELLDRLDVEPLRPVLDRLAAGDLKGAVGTVLDWPGDRDTLIEEIARACRKNSTVPEYEQAALLAERYPGDMGVVFALLLNLVELQPGQSLFVPARMPHAYLRGTGVEIMAGSDNVLRGGLTPKHVDIPELLKITDFTAVTPAPESARSDGEFAAPTDRFRLSVSRGGEHRFAGASAVLCLEGEITVRRNGATERIGRGEALFVPYKGGPVTLSGDGTAFRAAPGRPSRP